MAMGAKEGGQQELWIATQDLPKSQGHPFYEKLNSMLEEERINLQVAQTIYEARAAAGLTQAQLAELVGTSQSAIARLEDADYEGHSLTMLRRIGDALNQRIEVRFVPRDSKSKAA